MNATMHTQNHLWFSSRKQQGEFGALVYLANTDIEPKIGFFEEKSL